MQRNMHLRPNHMIRLYRFPTIQNPMRSISKRIFNPLALVLLCGLPLQAGITAMKESNNLMIEIDGKLFTEYRSDTWVRASIR